VSKSESQMAKEKKRKEHVERTLAAQRSKQTSTIPTKKGGTEESSTSSSAFQALFAKRAEGFVVDLQFRNAPPRPPVGPTFVGQGLKGELTNRWTEYRPGNAIEMNYMWKLHSEPDLGVSLGAFAMDLHGCYKVPKRAKLLQEQQQKKGKNDLNAVTDEDEEGGTAASKHDGLELHPDDMELLNWTGSMGDTAAEELKVRRERARASALLGAQGIDSMTPKKSQVVIRLKEEGAPTTGRKQKFSRVLDEDIQSWMKKTTYLTNDQYRSVHQFKSLADTKKETAEAVEKKLEEIKKGMLDLSGIDKSFESANSGECTLFSFLQVVLFPFVS